MDFMWFIQTGLVHRLLKLPFKLGMLVIVAAQLQEVALTM
jgi:hypothetical protein